MTEVERWAREGPPPAADSDNDPGVCVLLTIEFTVTDPLDLNGFANGDVRLSGDDSVVGLNSMVIVSATLLMDQLSTWYQGSTRILEYIAPDSRELVTFRKKGRSVTLWARGEHVGTEDGPTFLAAVLSAGEQLYESFGRRLESGDAAGSGLEQSLADFRRFVRGLPRSS